MDGKHLNVAEYPAPVAGLRRQSTKTQDCLVLIPHVGDVAQRSTACSDGGSESDLNTDDASGPRIYRARYRRRGRYGAGCLPRIRIICPASSRQCLSVGGAEQCRNGGGLQRTRHRCCIWRGRYSGQHENPYPQSWRKPASAFQGRMPSRRSLECQTVIRPRSVLLNERDHGGKVPPPAVFPTGCYQKPSYGSCCAGTPGCSVFFRDGSSAVPSPR